MFFQVQLIAEEVAKKVTSNATLVHVLQDKD